MRYILIVLAALAINGPAFAKDHGHGGNHGGAGPHYQAMAVLAKAQLDKLEAQTCPCDQYTQEKFDANRTYLDKIIAGGY